MSYVASKVSEPEFEQAVHEIRSTLGPLFKKHPEYETAFKVLMIPERILTFRVQWEDDKGHCQVNTGFRVQFSSVLGPYKGGLRLHPSVNLSILKFLGFEQIFKNALTGLHMGGGKGGSDFDPKGKSDAEIRRFCYAFMAELSRHIGPDTDVPAGDIGVGGREVGFLFGAYKQLRNEWSGVLTGKGFDFGGSRIRPEATGYGAVYYLEEMIRAASGEDFKGKRVLISGAGNVAQYAALKVIELGGSVLSLSDSKGALVAEGEQGLTADFVAQVADLKLKGGYLQDLSAPAGFKYVAGARPWTLVKRVDVAIPSATQNEVSGEEAHAMVAAGLRFIAEGANMPCTQEAIDVFEGERKKGGKSAVWYGPGKAANCGGVAVSGLEMAQNSARLQWTEQEVDAKLKAIMQTCFKTCYETAQQYAESGEPKSALAIVITIFFAVLLIARPTGGRSAVQRGLLEVGINPDLGFDELYEVSRTGWVPSVQREGLSDNSTEEQLSTWADCLPLECAEAWVEKGELCEDVRDVLGERGAVDVLWTYTNGSDPLLRTWRAEVTGMLSGRVRPGVAKVREAQTARHFREHDELRYSMRSVLQAFAPSAVRKIHLLTADIPTNGLLRDIIDPHRAVGKSTPVLTASRLGQRPTWLNASASGTPPLELSHHSPIFENPSHLPTFNSLSIESQFPSLRLASEHFLYMNDDTFLMGANKLVPADVGIPLLGPVFRIQTDLTVSGTSPSESAGDREGEWTSLKRANWLLDRRFGQRSRGYIAHIPKAFSLPLLREVGMIWHDELSETASSRFRGLNTEYQLAFLATHYIIESHRQALLRSFFVARSDRNLDGELSLGERRQMLEELGFDIGADLLDAGVSVFAPRRATKEHLPRLLARAGLAAPGATEIAFSSMDGHGIYRGAEQDPHKLARPVDYDGSSDQEEESKPYCTLKLARCFGDGFLSARTSLSSVQVFRRVAFEHTECGDCAIVALVGKSGPSGLSAFLPPPSPSPSSPVAHDLPSTPLSLFSPTLKDHSSPSSASAFALPSAASAAWIRQHAIRQILRYSYVLGDSSSNFQSMRQARLVQLVLDRLGEEAREKPTFLTLNDDFASDLASARADAYLKRFFESQWPDPSPYELVE
ncbi:hypothetical protein JCM21900_006418 [Sporobolomyces salmonicolor]